MSDEPGNASAPPDEVRSRAVRGWLGGVASFLRFRGPRSWGSAFLGSAAILGAGLLLVPDARTVNATSGMMSHSLINAELAINAIAFGKRAHVDERTFRVADVKDSLNSHLQQDESLYRCRALSLPAIVGSGSPDDHVRHLRPYQQSEPTVALLLEGVLRLDRDATLAGAFSALNVLNVAAIGAFALALLRCGASPLLATLAALASLRLLGESNVRPDLVGVYNALLPILLAASAASCLLLSAGAPKARWGPVAYLAAGVAASLVFHVRTSYGPILAALALAHLVFAAVDLRRTATLSRGRKAGHFAATVVAGVLGAALAETVLFAPMRVPGDPGTTNHVFAHPLVLALAVPENDLSRREGIEWLDARGIDLARRIDPGVQYLTPGYEAALMAYYRRLWSSDAAGMRRVYATKFDTAGWSALAHARETSYGPGSVGEAAIAVGVAPLGWVFSGFVFGALCLGTVAASVLALARAWLPPEAALLFGSLGGIGLLCYLESAVIYSSFSPWYHRPLVAIAAFLGHAAIAATTDRALARWGSPRGS